MEGKLRNDCENARKEAEFYKEKYFAAERKYHARIAGQDGIPGWLFIFCFFDLVGAFLSEVGPKIDQAVTDSFDVLCYDGCTRLLIWKLFF